MINKSYSDKRSALEDLLKRLEQLGGDSVKLRIRHGKVTGSINNQKVFIKLRLIADGEEKGMIDYTNVALPKTSKDELKYPIIRLVSEAIGIEPDFSYSRIYDSTPVFEWCRNPLRRDKRNWGIGVHGESGYYYPFGVVMGDYFYPTGAISLSYDGYVEGTIKDPVYGDCFIFGVNNNREGTCLFAQGSNKFDKNKPVFFSLRSKKTDTSFDCDLHIDGCPNTDYRRLVIQPHAFVADRKNDNTLAYSRVMAPLLKDSLCEQADTIYRSLQKAREAGEVLSADHDTLMQTLKKYMGGKDSTYEGKAPYQKKANQQ